MNAATFQQLEKVMNNPSESGIDVEAPVYVFTSPSFPYSTAVAKIKSEDDLHASFGNNGKRANLPTNQRSSWI